MSARSKELLEKFLELPAKEQRQLLDAMREKVDGDEEAEEFAGLPHEDPEFAAELRRRAKEGEERWDEMIPYEEIRARLGRADD